MLVVSNVKLQEPYFLFVLGISYNLEPTTSVISQLCLYPKYRLYAPLVHQTDII